MISFLLCLALLIIGYFVYGKIVDNTFGPDDRSGAPNGTTRRPDRVMIAGDRAVVVDYKFGDRDAERYRRQIGGYCTLLRGMGYARVEGYLWYVRRGEVERVV